MDLAVSPLPRLWTISLFRGLQILYVYAAELSTDWRYRLNYS